MTAKPDRHADFDGWAPDFHWLIDRLAVGGCFPMEQVPRLAEEHGIRAVIDLRSEACDDRSQLARAGIDFLHLPTTDMDASAVLMLDEGVAFATAHMDRDAPVLIHCQHGIGRSPLLALCVMVERGLGPLEALNLAKDRRAVVSPSEAQYKGWSAWLRAHGHEPPDWHTFGCIAYRHLANR